MNQSLRYADGLPMNTSTNPTANAFKYTAKKLSLFLLGVTCSRSDVLAAPAGLVTAQVDRVLGGVGTLAGLYRQFLRQARARGALAASRG
ncbi:MAG: hypothetical protein K2L14_10055 [Duncaniella sp.]|nr:hypothetical protein [Duncaniella sp.]